MGNYYQHPYRNFGNTPSEHAPVREQAAPQAEPAQAPPPQQQTNSNSGGGGDSGSPSVFALLFQGPNAKIVIPALFIVLSAGYVYLYDSLTAYSENGLTRQRARSRQAAEVEEINDEELSDRHFESSNQRGNWRPPEEREGTRSVEEAKSRAGFFGRLFCSGLRRSRWCG